MRLAIVVVEIPGAAAMVTETEIGGFQDTGTLADRPLEYQPASTIYQQVSRFLTLFSSREGRIEAVARLTQTSINFFTGVLLARKLKLNVASPDEKRLVGRRFLNSQDHLRNGERSKAYAEAESSKKSLLLTVNPVHLLTIAP